MTSGSLVHTASVLSAFALALLLTPPAARAESAAPLCDHALIGPWGPEIPANTPSFQLVLYGTPAQPDPMRAITLSQTIDGNPETPVDFDVRERVMQGEREYAIVPRAPFTAGARILLRTALCEPISQQFEFIAGPALPPPTPPATLTARTLGVVLGGGVLRYEVELAMSAGSGTLAQWLPALSTRAEISGVSISPARIFDGTVYLYGSINCRNRVGELEEGEDQPVTVRVGPYGLDPVFEVSDTIDIDCDDASFVEQLPTGVRRPLTQPELEQLDPDALPFEGGDGGAPIDPDAGTIDPDTMTSGPERARSGCSVAPGASGASASMLVLAVIALLGRAARVRRGSLS